MTTPSAPKLFPFRLTAGRDPGSKIVMRFQAADPRDALEQAFKQQPGLVTMKWWRITLGD